MRVRNPFAAIGIALSLSSGAYARPVAPSSITQSRISVSVEGNGQDVILIPGLASSRDVWAGLATTLLKGHRVHLVQVAGFAGSPAARDSNRKVAAPTAEAIADYIRHEHIKTPIVIGHSLGGEMALMLGARHPDAVGRLVIVDALPFYSLLIDPAATSAAMMPRAAEFRDALLAASPAQADAMQMASIARLVKTETARPALVAAGLKSDRRTVADATYELMTTDLRPELGRITAPTEIIYAYDPIYGVPASKIGAIFRTAYSSTPSVHFVRIDGSFHFIMFDQPKAFTQAVLDFIDPKTR